MLVHSTALLNSYIQIKFLQIRTDIALRLTNAHFWKIQMPNHKIIELSSFLVNSHLQTRACNLQDHQIPLLPHQTPILSLSFLLVWLFSSIGYLKNPETSSFLNCGCLKFRSYGVILAHQSMLSNHPSVLTAMKNNGLDWKGEGEPGEWFEFVLWCLST